jgi:GxxExxY protein
MNFGAHNRLLVTLSLGFVYILLYLVALAYPISSSKAFIMIQDKLSEQVIAAAYTVHNVLGSGYYEQVYENSMVIELRKRGITVQQQMPITVYYENVVVGDYKADLFVDNQLIVELKAVERIKPIDEVQLVNYLKGTNNPYGLLINFGSRVNVRRKYRDYISSDDSEDHNSL